MIPADPPQAQASLARTGLVTPEAYEAYLTV
jgi:hypothetical protein